MEEAGASPAYSSDEVLGRMLYGADPGEGEPLADYGVQLHGFFDAREREARMINDSGELEHLAKVKNATNQAFRDYMVGSARVNEIMTQAHHFERNPANPEALERLGERTQAVLRSEYGSKTPALLEGAQRVAVDLCNRIPGFKDILQNGLGSDEKFVRMCITAARKRGYV